MGSDSKVDLAKVRIETHRLEFFVEKNFLNSFVSVKVTSSLKVDLRIPKKNCCTQLSNFCHVLCVTSQDGVSKNLITCRILSRRPLELGVSWLR